MNATVYLFGEFNSGYTQYPDDYTSVIFDNFYKKAKSTAQIVIHRDDNLMYYGYIRKLEQERYIGLCVVLNGLLLTRIDGLFSLYENTISGLVTRGQLIHFNEQGNIVTNVEKLYMNKEEVDLLSESLRMGFNGFESYSKVLPANCFGISKDSANDFAVDDNLDEIIKSSYTNGYTFIYKSKSFNTAQMNSYKGVLSRVNKEKNELQEKLEDLQVEHAKTLRQKKQIKYVFTLFVVLIGCTMSLFSLNDSLKDTRNNLSDANETISSLENVISLKNDTINSQIDHISRLGLYASEENTRRITAEQNIDNLKKKISDRQPFIVKGTSFNYNTGYLHLDYYGMTDKNVMVDVRAYNDYGTHFRQSSNIDIQPGDNSTSIFVSCNLDNNKWYSFEILIGNVIIGGDRH